MILGPVRVVIVAVAIFSLAVASPERAFASSKSVPEPNVRAASAIVVDSSDGQVLWEKNARERRSIASTTKIVTALVVLSRTSVTDVVTASQRAEDIGTDDPLITEIGLRRGERLPVEPLLYAMLLQSANDAAVALAEHVAGSVEEFVVRMNEMAATVGAKDSHFVNPHGLDDAGHYSSALDLVTFTREALKNESFRKMVATSSYELNLSGRAPQTLRNRNQLLTSYSGADGVKTGQTRAAGRSLVASARRNGEGRIVVVLSSPDPFDEAARLLNYGFDGFVRHVITKRSEAWGFVTYGTGATHAIMPTRDSSVLLARDSEPAVELSDLHLIVTVSGKEFSRIPVLLECRTRPCDQVTRTPLSDLLSRVGPILSAIVALLTRG